MGDIKQSHRTVRQAYLFAIYAVVVGSLMLLVPFIMLAAQHFENTYFPVVTDIKVSLVESKDDKMTFSMVGNKVRQCKMTDIRVLVDVDGPGQNDPIRGVIYPVNEGRGSMTRPLGYQSFGLWSIQPAGKKLNVEVSYSCHPFWETTQKLGEWEPNV